MSRAFHWLFLIGGIVLLMFGFLFAIDGLLPTRSAGPNPAWVEVALGVVCAFAGWALRSAARKK